MQIEFIKMEGIGNDFILMDDRRRDMEHHIPYGELAVKLCNRKFGIGADGIILILASQKEDLGFRIFNSDGSEAQMCGNGMRCFAKLVYERQIVDKARFSVETLAGPIIPEIVFGEDGRIDSIRVDMGEPVLDPQDIPFRTARRQAIAEPISVDGREVLITAVSMGNPHAVIFVDSVDTAPVTTLGPLIETHERFPEKTNVEFIEVVSDTELRMKVWERGAGVTLACGTGACAALVAASLNQKSSTQAVVHLDGGDLTIEWERRSNHIYKSGPARIVFTGRVEI